jgi:hypothetical protein
MERSAAVQATLDRHFPSRTHPYRICEPTITSSQATTCVTSAAAERGAKSQKIQRAIEAPYRARHVHFEIDKPAPIMLTGSVCEMIGIEGKSIILNVSQRVMEHADDPEAERSNISRAFKHNSKYILAERHNLIFCCFQYLGSVTNCFMFAKPLLGISSSSFWKVTVDCIGYGPGFLHPLQPGLSRHSPSHADALSAMTASSGFWGRGVTLSRQGDD